MRFSLNFLLFIMVLLHNGKFCNVFAIQNLVLIGAMCVSTYSFQLLTTNNSCPYTKNES